MGYADEMGGRDCDSLPKPRDNDLIPPGWYECTCLEAKDGRSQSGGAYLTLTWRIDGPTQATRQVWGRHNYRNDNPKAEEIGLGELHALARAAGRDRLPRDLVSYGGLRVQVRIGVEKPREGYEQRNEVRGYKALDRAALPKPGPSATASTIPAPAPQSTPEPADPDEDLPF